MSIVLYKQVNKSWRYYKVCVYKNLLNEYALEIQFGSCFTQNVHYHYISCPSIFKALQRFQNIVKLKEAKGYTQEAFWISKPTKDKQGGYLYVA